MSQAGLWLARMSGMSGQQEPPGEQIVFPHPVKMMMHARAAIGCAGEAAVAVCMAATGALLIVAAAAVATAVAVAVPWVALLVAAVGP